MERHSLQLAKVTLRAATRLPQVLEKCGEPLDLDLALNGSALVFADGRREIVANGPGGGVEYWSGMAVPVSTRFGPRRFTLSGSVGRVQRFVARQRPGRCDNPLRKHHTVSAASLLVCPSRSSLGFNSTMSTDRTAGLRPAR